MGRQIDAEKLKEHYAWWQNENKKIFDTIIDLQPTVREVVECSQCRFGIEKKDNTVLCACGFFQDLHYHAKNFFCGYGEKDDVNRQG